MLFFIDLSGIPPDYIFHLFFDVFAVDGVITRRFFNSRLGFDACNMARKAQSCRYDFSHGKDDYVIFVVEVVKCSEQSGSDRKVERPVFLCPFRNAVVKNSVWDEVVGLMPVWRSRPALKIGKAPRA